MVGKKFGRVGSGEREEEGVRGEGAREKRK